MSGLDFTTAVAGVLAVIILVDVSVLVVSGRPVPELLSNLAFGVFGFYFGRRMPLAPPDQQAQEGEKASEGRA